MSVSQLLVSTTLSTVPRPSALELRKQFLDLVKDGEPQTAMRMLYIAFFFSPFSERSEAIKRHLLAKVWNEIETHYRSAFFSVLEETSKFLRTAVRKSMDDGIDGLEHTANLFLLTELLAEREFAAELGKCATIVGTMCAKNGTITPGCLSYVTEQLR